MFALLLLPLVMFVGLAVEYSFFVAAKAQLYLATDAAALHATRVASQTQQTGAVGALQKGQCNPNGNANNQAACATAAGALAGQQWFAAQLGKLSPGVSLSNGSPSVQVTYNVAPSTFTSNVSASAVLASSFPRLFQAATLPMSTSASAVVTNSYVEVIMLLDNSPSMLLGSTSADIATLEQATPCSKQAVAMAQNNLAQPMSAYAWNYSPYTFTPSAGYLPPPSPPSPPVGSCDTRFSNDANADVSECFYVPTSSQPIVNGSCSAASGGGVPTTYKDNSGVSHTVYVPQAPCAFACHNDPSNNDYFGLARSLGVTLRLDVVQAAAANVIGSLQSLETAPNQFSVGIYQFNTKLQQVFPTVGEASTDLQTAQTLVASVKNTPPLTNDSPYTDFPTSAKALANQLTHGSDGSSPTNPQKNIFIVTDGLQDVQGGGVQPNTVALNIGGAPPRIVGAMTSATHENICQQFKNLGFSVYVLYTPFLPVPNPFYLTNIKQFAEPTGTSTNVQALQACASGPGAPFFYSASDPTAINNAMLSMLLSALNKPARIQN